MTVLPMRGKEPDEDDDDDDEEEDEEGAVGMSMKNSKFKSVAVVQV